MLFTTASLYRLWVSCQALDV